LTIKSTSHTLSQRPACSAPNTARNELGHTPLMNATSSLYILVFN